MLNKHDFTEQLLSQVDVLYEAYLAVPEPAENLFPNSSRPIATPDMPPYQPQFGTAELQADIDKLAKEAGAERIALKIGGIALNIIMTVARGAV